MSDRFAWNGFCIVNIVTCKTCVFILVVASAKDSKQMKEIWRERERKNAFEQTQWMCFVSWIMSFWCWISNVSKLLLGCACLLTKHSLISHSTEMKMKYFLIVFFSISRFFWFFFCSWMNAKIGIEKKKQRAMIWATERRI